MTTIDAGDGSRKQLTADEVQENANTSRWFYEQVTVPPQAQEFLQGYAQLKHDEVIPHVSSLRQRAFAKWPYPRIGHCRFLDLTASTHPAYGDVVDRLKRGQTYLDAGCCFGQDIRKLLFNGAPSSAALYGTDIEPAFFELGKELFRDLGWIESSFFGANLTRSSITNPIFERIRNSVDVISAQSLFHLFTLDDQRTVAKHLVSLSKPVSGSMIIGRQVGSREGGNRPGLTRNTTVFAHSSDTWRAFWGEIGDATGSKWRVEVVEEDAPDRVKRQEWYSPDLCIIVFTVVRRCESAPALERH